MGYNREGFPGHLQVQGDP
uniref:Uncharacterized protein n=1 Tax=Anguilla anguilla TaxID=7936 RepID=A0A0E9QDY9_ANGAN